MATAQQVSLDIESNEASIELTIKDGDTVEYLKQFDQDERNDAAERAFRVGALTLQLGETSNFVR